MRKIFLCALCLLLAMSDAWTKNQIDVLYITGHTDKYHSWEIMSAYQVALLREVGIFRVDVVTLPQQVTHEKLSFNAYDVVVFNMNEVTWPERLKKQFERYIRKGGGLVVVHEADNAFPEWSAFNRMIALAGWGDRGEEAGPFYYWEAGKMVSDSKSTGSAGKHGKRVPYTVNVRNPQHPIVRGMPTQWLHVEDELYGNLRGPAEQVEVIATAFSEAESGGTGKEEPVLFTVGYGRGRIFHCVLGHTKRGFDKALKNVGYQLVFQRGTQWAATGDVTLPLPSVELSAQSPTLRSLEEIIKH